MKRKAAAYRRHGRNARTGIGSERGAVFASNDRFLIVEKLGAAARDAHEADPRS
jgi:hypothetical protein